MTLEPGNPGPSREYRASVTFAIGGLFVLVVLLLVGGLLSATPPIRGVVALFGVLLGVIAMLATALGLAYGRPWAAAAATPMLVLLVIGGAIEFGVAITHSSIDFPIGAILALWALRAPLRTTPDPATGGRSWGAASAFVVLAVLLSTGWPVVSNVLLSAGGPLIVGADALQPSLGVICDGPPGTAPTAVHIKYDWRWAHTELLASGSDTVTLTGFSVADDGQPGYALDSTETASAGTWQSDVIFREETGVLFGIDLGQAGFAPGSVGIKLIPSGSTPATHGSVDVRAVYRHAPADTSTSDASALWRVVTLAQCAW